jgi:hypothetical protein
LWHRAGRFASLTGFSIGIEVAISGEWVDFHSGMTRSRRNVVLIGAEFGPPPGVFWK